MGFHEVQFPTDISYGSSSATGLKSEILEVDSGLEEIISRWSNPRRYYDVGYGIRSYESLTELIRFFVARNGAANGFRFKDWVDFTSNADGSSDPTMLDQQIGSGDGTTTTFQLVKRYTSGGITKTRVITKPIESSVLVAVNGVSQTSGWTVNSTTGLVTFSSAPVSGAVTAGFEFDVPVRFTDVIDKRLSVTLEDYSSGKAEVSLVEVLSPLSQEEFFYGGAKRIEPLASDYTLSILDGRVIYAVPNASGRKLILPDPADLPAGGPHFYLFNGSATQTLAVHYPSGTPLFTIAVENSKTMLIGYDGSGNKEWLWT